MWPFKSKKQQQVREVKAVLGINDELANLLKFGHNKGETPASALQLYEDSSAVSIPVNKVADAFAGLNLVLQIGDEIIREHEVLDLLSCPSSYYDQELFLETLAKNYLITNESHVVAIGAVNRPPLELQPISPANASINEGKGGAPGTIVISGTTLTGNYVPDTRKRKVRYLNGGLRELHYIRGFSTKNNSLLRGQSLLLSAGREARQHILGGDHNVSILEKGGRVSLVFHFEEDMEPDDFKAVKESIDESYAGANKAGKIGVTSGGKLKIQELAKNNKDMDFAELQKMAKFAVALQYKVPLPLITVDAATFNNYGVANLALYDDAVLPLAGKILNGLSLFLLPRYGIDPARARITYDIDAITALAIRRNEELKLRSEVNIESDNELRAMIGREPYTGGDTFYKPANLQPVGTDSDTDDIPRIIRDTE